MQRDSEVHVHDSEVHVVDTTGTSVPTSVGTTLMPRIRAVTVECLFRRRLILMAMHDLKGSLPVYDIDRELIMLFLDGEPVLAHSGHSYARICVTDPEQSGL